MGLLENLFGLNPEYTVRDNRTGEEKQIYDAKELEKYAKQEQNNDDQPKDFLQRIFSR